MPKFHVITAVTQYWLYEVEAHDARAAEKMVDADREGPKKLRGYPNGYDEDDTEWAIEVREV